MEAGVKRQRLDLGEDWDGSGRSYERSGGKYDENILCGILRELVQNITIKQNKLSYILITHGFRKSIPKSNLIQK